MPRRLASGYPSSPFSLLFSGQCPDMSYSGGFSPGVPPLPIPNREVKPGRADGTAPQCGRVGRRLLSGEPSRKRGGSCFLCSFSIFFQILRRGGRMRPRKRPARVSWGWAAPAVGGASSAGLELGQVRCCRARRLRLAVPEGCGKAEATGADIIL